MASENKINDGVPSWMWFLLFVFVFFIGLVVYLIAKPASEKTAGGERKLGQTQVVPQPQWFLTWQKLPGAEGQESGRFLVRLVQRDTVLIVSDPNGGFFVGNRQPDGSYNGEWKDPQGRKGSFEKLFFDADGKIAHGWSIGTKGERAYLVLQRE